MNHYILNLHIRVFLLWFPHFLPQGSCPTILITSSIQIRNPYYKSVYNISARAEYIFSLPVWADSENGVNGSDFLKEKILRKRSSAHAQLIKISLFYVKTRHSGKLIVQSGLFICRSENTFKRFIRHVSTECIWQKYTFVGQIKFYLLSKFVNSVSDDEANKVNKLMFFP